MRDFSFNDSMEEESSGGYNQDPGVKKKCSQKELFDLIIECANEWKSLEEIAREIKRNPQYLKGFMRKMVDEGLLQRAFPVPNHPAQRYKRISKGDGE